MVVDLIKSRKFSWRALLFAGALGTGKTALAQLSLYPRNWEQKCRSVPVGSEVYSAEVKETEMLAEAFRRAIGTLRVF